MQCLKSPGCTWLCWAAIMVGTLTVKLLDDERSLKSLVVMLGQLGSIIVIA